MWPLGARYLVDQGSGAARGACKKLGESLVEDAARRLVGVSGQGCLKTPE